MHRLIKHFMVQGGDPTGTGKGGESIFGQPFEDEFCKMFSHEGRGILSMANSGVNTNKSQFFITFRSCKHLDNKHTIFGRVVGGMDILSKIESVKTDDKDKPTESITILKTIVFVDPFKEAEDMIQSERTKLEQSNQTGNSMSVKKRKEESKPKPFRKGIGAFINLEDIQKKMDSGSDQAPKSKKAKSSFGNFESW